MASDPLQTGGALVPETDEQTPLRAAGRARRSPFPFDLVRDQYHRQVVHTPETRMVPGVLRVDGRRLHYAISDNESAYGPDGPGSPPIWAVNIHGYFAGGGMYWRESARLAQRHGWRVVNPSLPGFGGSDSLQWDQISMESLAKQVELILKDVGAGPVVILGHSMGGAVAVQYAYRHANRTLGIIYRDGVAPPAWKRRRGLLPTLIAPFAPDVAPLIDMVAAVVLDTPDLFLGRMYSTMRSMLPDFRRNIRTMGRTMPVGSMLMTVDLRPEVRSLAALNMPILAEWGCFDRVATGATAREFADVAKTSIQWLPGGHSWMLARPQGQSDVLTHVASGRTFLHQVEDRWRRINSIDRSLRAVN
jgi:pimeloyl-ACP methyl ester carboxylesterase